jgi:hypothetical protein
MSATAEAEVDEPAARAHQPPHSAARDFLSRTPVRVALVSSPAHTASFCRKHIEAVDLPSHLYNAWLAILIGEGKAPGLKIVSQSSNVLFDVMLSGLIRAVGPWGAEHLAVPLCVLVFAWGAFAAVCAVTRRRPWYILAFIAAGQWLRSYGLLNLLVGWLRILGVRASVEAKIVGGVRRSPLIALAWSAHPLPVAWLLGAMAYTWVARRIPPRARPILTFASLAALVILRTFLLTHFATRWTAEQGISMTGADQLGVFESKYQPLVFGLLVIWFSLFVRLWRRKGPARLLFGIPFQLCVIVAAAVLLFYFKPLFSGNASIQWDAVDVTHRGRKRLCVRWPSRARQTGEGGHRRSDGAVFLVSLRRHPEAELRGGVARTERRAVAVSHPRRQRSLRPAR